MGSGDWEEAVGGKRPLFQYSCRVLSGEGLGQRLLRDTGEQQFTLVEINTPVIYSAAPISCKIPSSQFYTTGISSKVFQNSLKIRFKK